MKKIDLGILVPVLTVLFAFFAYVALLPESSSRVLNSILAYINYNTGWLVMPTGLGILIFLLWLALSRYGQVKLGGEDDEPEFSYFSWIAMIFTAGVGGTLIYWSFLEPVYYMQWPPFGFMAESQESVEWALTYGLFHWGPTAWAFYTLPAIPIAYAFYVRKKKLRISSACSGVIGGLSEGFVGKIIDVTLIFGLIGGTGTAIGFLAPMIAALIGEATNIQSSLTLIVIVICLWTLLFAGSVFLGLDKGIKRLSIVNLYVVFGLLLFVFLFGPKIFILSYFVDSVGRLAQNYISMSLWLDPIINSGFPQDWTVFYWFWWLSYVPMVGLFVARISKGRTIREVIIGMLVWGTLGHWVFFAVFGGYGVHLQINDYLSLTSILSEGGVTATTIGLLKTLPISSVMLPVVAISMLIFSATCYDSASYVMASIASKEMEVDMQPARWHRVFWALMLGGIGITLSSLGTLQAVQVSSVIVGLPIIIVVFLMSGSLLKWLKEDEDEKLKNVKYKTKEEARG